MTIRLDVVELLYCFDPRRSLWPTHLVHHDGRPYTPQENVLVASATEEEQEMARTFAAAGDEHRQKRYDDVMALLSAAAQADVPEDDARGFHVEADSPLLPPDVTVSELQERANEETAAVVAAFRAHILPHLDGWERGQALDRLGHLDPQGTAPGDEDALREFRVAKLADLKRLKELMNTYGPASSAPLASYWDSIPGSAQAEARGILHRLGWVVPGEGDGETGTTA